MDSPREIIERIRRDKFAIGLATTDDKWLRFAQETRERLNRAVEKLSEDLYSKEMHFILELIQKWENHLLEVGNNFFFHAFPVFVTMF